MPHKSSPVEQRASTGSLLAGVALVLSVLQALVQVPILLRFWSPREYGLWVAVLAAVALMTSLDAGHLNYVGNLFNRFWIDDRKQLQKVFASGVLAALMLAGIELVAGLALFCFGKAEWLTGPLPEGGEHEAFRAAFFFYLLFWVVQGSFGGLCARLYQPAGQFARAQVIGIVYYMAGFIALVGAVMAGASLPGAMLAQIGAWGGCNLYMLWDVRKRFPEFYPWWRGGDFSTAWRNFRISLILTVNGIVEQAASSGLIFLVMAFLAPAEVAVFTTIRTVANTALRGLSVILHPVLPDVVRYHFQREPAKLDAVFGVAWLMAGTGVCLCFSLGSPFLEGVYSYWTQKSLSFDATLFSYMVLSVCVRQWATPFQTYLHGVNHLPPQTVAVSVRSGATLIVAWSFLREGGMPVAGMSLLIGECLAAVIYFFAARRCMRELMGDIRLVPVFLSLAQIMMMGVGLFAGVLVPSWAIWASASSSVAILLLAVLQWNYLDSDVRRRVLDLAKRR